MKVILSADSVNDNTIITVKKQNKVSIQQLTITQGKDEQFIQPGGSNPVVLIDSCNIVCLNGIKVQGLVNRRPKGAPAGEGCAGVQIIGSKNIYFDSDTICAGKGMPGYGSNVLFPGGSGGDAVTTINSQDIIINNSVLYGGLGGDRACNIYGCGSFGSNGASLFLKNNSTVSIINCNLFMLPQIDSTSKLINNNSIITSIHKETLVKTFNLSQNYPNPFNPTTKISFNVSEPAQVSLTVYNLLGEKIKEIVNSNYVRGSYTEEFKANNLSSGIYICKLNANTNSKIYTKSIKMLLLK